MTKETLLNLAELSNLAIDDNDCARLAAEMQDLCDLAKLLQSNAAEPRQDDALSLSALREDAVGDSLSREVLLSAAPVHDGESFLVPRTVEE